MITGASSGFGKAMAHRFAKEGWNLIVTGRREERLNELSNELTAQFDVEVLVKFLTYKTEKKFLMHFPMMIVWTM